MAKADRGKPSHPRSHAARLAELRAQDAALEARQEIPMPTPESAAPAKAIVLFDDMPTSFLKSARDALRHPVATDASFAAAVASVLGALLDRELRDAARLARDADEAKNREQAAAKQLATAAV